MELEYQTHRDVDINKQLNRLDKVTSKLSLTVKDLSSDDSIQQYLKDKLVNYAAKDQAKQILRMLDKEVIAWNREVGPKNSRWNIIHICAKFNAVNCVRAILKQLYQLQSDQYVKGVNSQTSEGFTPLMISIIYHGDKVLELLLQLGGVDLSIIQRGKLRAYDLALHYRNQCAISHLIVYEDRCRKKQFLNEQQLQKPEPALEEKIGFCQSFTNYLLDCFICFKYEDENHQKLFAKSPFFKKEEGDAEIDAVKVGSRKDTEDYQILWRPLSAMEGQKAALFDNFKPQDICENQFSLKNDLILNQTLSDFPWLLRKVITKLDNLPGNPQRYCVNLYHNYLLKKIEVDQCVPIVKERGQPMFLSNRSEVWPMMLQKAMAKIYGSYLALNTISSAEALETITGFFVKQIALSELAGSHGIVAALQDLSLRGYLFLLQGRPRTQLNTGSEVNSYAVLNCYEKGNTKKVLISCPTIIQNWHETKDIRQLAILKAHFTRHNQSCLWIDESKLQYYFTHATVAFLKEGYVRSQFKMKLKIKGEGEVSIKTLDEKQTGNEDHEENLSTKQYKKSIFFKFKTEKKSDDPILLQITDMETRHKFDLTDLEGWRNQGSQALVREEEHPNCPQLAKLACFPGEYLCKFELKTHKILSKRNSLEPPKGIMKKKQAEQQSSECHKKVRLNLGPQHLRQLLLIAWGPEQIQLELIQEEFGTIEWLENYRNYVDQHWDKFKLKGQQFFFETANGKTIIVAKKVSSKKMYFVLGQCGEQAVVEGKWSLINDEAHIQMINEAEGGCAYCVLSGLQLETIKNGKLLMQ